MSIVVHEPPASARSSHGYLATINRHPRDDLVRFDAGPHHYWVHYPDGWRHDFKSVTTCIKRFFSEFNPDATIAKMRKSKNFKPGHELWGKTDDEIKTIWANKRDAGSDMHAMFEKHFNGEFISEDDMHKPEWRIFVREFLPHIGCTPYRTEWFVHCRPDLEISPFELGHYDCGIVGAIDFTGVVDHLCTDKVLVIHIIDYKRIPNFYMSKWMIWYTRLFGTGPLAHIKDKTYWHYALQMWLYAWILETYYRNVTYNGKVYERIHVYTCALVVIHPDEPIPGIFQVPCLRHEVSQVVAAINKERWIGEYGADNLPVPIRSLLRKLNPDEFPDQDAPPVRAEEKEDWNVSSDDDQ